MFSQLLHLVESILVAVASLPRTLLVWLRDWLHYRKLANRFPGPPARPLVGNLLDCGYPPDALTIVNWMLDDVMYRYPAGQIWIGPVRLILLSDERDIQKFLINSKNQLKPEKGIEFVKYVLGDGLFTLTGDVWRRLHNKFIKPSFHQNILNTYVSVFNRKADVFVECLSQHANGCVFDVKHMTETLTADTIYETIFGVPSDQLTDPDHPDNTLINIMSEAQKEIALRVTKPWLFHNGVYNLTANGRRAKELLNRARGLLKSTAEKRAQIVEAASPMSSEMSCASETPSAHDSNSKKDPSILIDALLEESGQSESGGNVVDNMLTFYFAGFDTTSITLQFILYYLAKNPMVQEKAMMELQKMFNATGSTEITPDALQQMQYVEMIVKEALRMHPPAFFFMRTAGVDTPLVSCDLVVPAGAYVVIPPKKMHMDPRLFPDPHVFDPERFSPENCAKRHPCAYIPFAAGLRSCVGKKFAMMEIKTIIGKIIWNYRVLPDEFYQPHLHWGITMTTINGMKIRLLKR